MTFRERVTIQPGGTIEIRNPDFPAGAEAEVIVLVESPKAESVPMASFIGKGKGCFADAADVDAFLRAERDSWER